jgi:hypothetical protein
LAVGYLIAHRRIAENLSATTKSRRVGAAVAPTDGKACVYRQGDADDVSAPQVRDGFSPCYPPDFTTRRGFQRLPSWLCG